MLTADNVTVYGGEVDSLIEASQQQIVSNKLYMLFYVHPVFNKVYMLFYLLHISYCVQVVHTFICVYVIMQYNLVLAKSCAVRLSNVSQSVANVICGLAGSWCLVQKQRPALRHWSARLGNDFTFYRTVLTDTTNRCIITVTRYLLLCLMIRGKRFSIEDA